MKNTDLENKDTPGHVNTADSMGAASGSMEDFAEAADLVALVADAETNGDAVGAILKYRHKIRHEIIATLAAVAASDDERTRFETRMLLRGFSERDLVKTQDDDYAHEPANSMWQGWQMSRGIAKSAAPQSSSQRVWIVRHEQGDHVVLLNSPPSDDLLRRLSDENRRTVTVEEHLMAPARQHTTGDSASTPVADLWIYEDMARLAMDGVCSLPRKKLESSYRQAAEDVLYWQRRALTVEQGAKRDEGAVDESRADRAGNATCATAAREQSESNRGVRAWIERRYVGDEMVHETVNLQPMPADHRARLEQHYRLEVIELAPVSPLTKMRTTIPDRPVAWRMLTPEQGSVVFLTDPAEAARFGAMDGREIRPLGFLDALAPFDVPPSTPDKSSGCAIDSTTSGISEVEWRLVPVVPTEAMTTAAVEDAPLIIREHWNSRFTGTVTSLNSAMFAAAYAAMLAAAPRPNR